MLYALSLTVQVPNQNRYSSRAGHAVRSFFPGGLKTLAGIARLKQKGLEKRNAATGPLFNPITDSRLATDMQK